MEILIFLVILISSIIIISLIIMLLTEINNEIEEKVKSISNTFYKKSKESNVIEKKLNKEATNEIEEDYELDTFEERDEEEKSNKKITLNNQEYNYNSRYYSNPFQTYQHNYLYDDYFSEEMSTFDEEYQETFELYVSDYEDLDYYDYLDDDYFSEEICTFEEEYKAEFREYVSEYEDLDYYDYVDMGIDVELIYTKPNVFYDDYYYDKDNNDCEDDYFDEFDEEECFDDLDDEDLYDDIILSSNKETTNIAPSLNDNKPINQYIINKNNSEEYLISLFGEDKVVRIPEKEEFNKTQENQNKTEQVEDIDKYLKMFFGENCDLNKLKNNQDKNNTNNN